MRLVDLRVQDFGCVKEAHVRFGPGLNVLFGPNDLGKSSLAEAIRCALLLQHGSSYGDDFTPWRSDATPRVELLFQTEPQRFWRVRKTFGGGSRGSSVFEFSKDGRSFTVEVKGRAVDGEIRKHLRWGIPEPGGRGGPRGLPDSFLTTVLLARQGSVTELFGRSLGDDPDDSGKKRIAEALQAATQDPLFAKILECTQAKVDEAFTPTGRLRRGHASPFAQVKEQLNQAERELKELEDRVQDSEAVRDRVQELTETLVFEEEERKNAKTALEQITAIAKKDENVERAREELLRIEKLREEAERAAAAQETAAAQLETLGVEVERRQGAVGAAESQVADAKREVSRLESDEGAQARLAHQRGLEKDIAETNAELERLQGRAERARGVKELDARCVAKGTELEKLEAAIEKEQEELAGCEKTVSDAESNLHALKGILLWIRRRELEGRLHEGKERAKRKAELETEVAAAGRQAEELAEEASAANVPDRAALGELRDLERALRLAEAKLDVALSIELEAVRDLEVEVAGERKTVKAAEVAHYVSQGELALDLVDIAKIRVRGGSAETHREREAARGRFDAVVAPALAAAGAGSLEELERAVEAATVKQTQVEARRAHAAVLRERLEALASSTDDAGTLEARLGDVEAKLAGYPRDLLKERAEGFGPAQLTAVENEIVGCERSVAAAKERRAELEKTGASNDSLRTALRQALHELVHQRDEASEALGDPWAEVLAQSDSRRAELTDELGSKSAELEALLSGQDSELKKAKDKLAVAERGYQEAKEALASQDAAFKEKKAAVDTLGGEARARRQVAEGEDYDAAKTSLERLIEERDSLPRPARIQTVTEEVREEAERRFAEAERTVRALRGDLRNAEGALAQVGGEVVRERRAGAIAALERFRKAERDLALDYNAWQLLLETLKEAERTQASHLGQTMVEPVAKRFAELTANRYGELALGPDLELDGVEALGGTRELTRLSVGTQEQLSTIFRLSLAEQLESAVLLDDQLTQTDPKRMNWFKQRLRELAGTIQIIVFTCRPHDYLQDGEVPEAGESYESENVSAVNLERVIERVG